MAATSGKQYRAMAAAMSGHSNLGIPASVGREFVEETPPEKRSRYAKKRKKRRGKRSEMAVRMQKMAEME